MDNITNDVKRMYEQYPYPSPDVDASGLFELRNLLMLLCRELELDLDNKRVLDAGSGSGHRLIEAAKAFPRTEFTGIDITQSSLEIARRLANQSSLGNVTFQTADILGNLEELGQFDLVLCMGVLHHLSNPLEGLINLQTRMGPKSMLVLYLYGALGAQERMRRKSIVKTLLKEREDYKTGIELLKELKFDTFEYGWLCSNGNSSTIDSMLVDAYMHTNENLYTSQSIQKLIEQTDLAAYAIYGITTGKSGLLFDVRMDCGRMTFTASPGEFITGSASKKAFESLPLAQQIHVLDLLYQPNGYTVLAFGHDGLDTIPIDSRLHANMVRLESDFQV